MNTEHFIRHPEALDFVSLPDGKLHEFIELWDTRYNRPEQMTDNEWYSHCMGHIVRILAMWSGGMTPRVSLLALYRRLLPDGKQKDLVDALIGYEVEQENGCHVDALIYLDQMINKAKELEAHHDMMAHDEAEMDKLRADQESQVCDDESEVIEMKPGD